MNRQRLIPQLVAGLMTLLIGDIVAADGFTETPDTGDRPEWIIAIHGGAGSARRGTTDAEDYYQALRDVLSLGSEQLDQGISHVPCFRSGGFGTGASVERTTSSALEVKEGGRPRVAGRSMGRLEARPQRAAGRTSGGRRGAGGRSALSGNARAETSQRGRAVGEQDSVHGRDGTTGRRGCRTNFRR